MQECIEAESLILPEEPVPPDNPNAQQNVRLVICCHCQECRYTQTEHAINVCSCIVTMLSYNEGQDLKT